MIDKARKDIRTLLTEKVSEFDGQYDLETVLAETDRLDDFMAEYNEANECFERASRIGFVKEVEEDSISLCEEEMDLIEKEAIIEFAKDLLKGDK